MSSNTFGKAFCVTTWGESHGAAIGCVIDGCPAGLELTEKSVQRDLDRRKPGQSSVTTSRGEEDKVRILSGVFEGKTIGTPISMIVMNEDADSSKYKDFINMPRPGHADLTWQEKFGIRDWRGGGRASARETVGRVATGSVAKGLLSSVLGLRVVAYSKEIGGVKAKDVEIRDACKAKDTIYSNSVRALDEAAAGKMENAILKAKNNSDSVGGIVECVALNVPAGLGEPVFDKLTADLAKAVMSIPAAKGVEIGVGFKAAGMKGSEMNDEIIVKKGKIETKTNNSGGMNGGISNGMPIVLRVAFKPTASIGRRQETVDLRTREKAEIKIEGRHDPCVVPRAVPVVEAMVALVLADHGLRSGLIQRKLK